MRGMRWLLVLALLVGATESRSVRLDLLNLVKHVALDDPSSTNDVGDHGGAGRTDQVGVGKDSKVGFILFGNLEDLEKYRIELNDDDNTNEKNVKPAPVVNEENQNDLEEPLEISQDLEQQKEKNNERVEEEEDEDEEEEFEDEEGEKDNNFDYKLLENYEEDEDEEEDNSQDYANENESEGDDNVAVDIFSEDEYNDYDDKENDDEAEQSEEDESDEDRFYDEEEKYYENENNKERNDKEESMFDGMFSSDS